MEIKYQNRGDWKGRGRPPRQPSERVLQFLRYTATSGTMATVTLDEATYEADLRELLADLRAGERVLNGQVRYQVAGKDVNFYWTPPRRETASGPASN